MTAVAKAGEKLLLYFSKQRIELSIPENVDKRTLVSRISITLESLNNISSLLENDIFVFNRIMYKNSRQHQKMLYYQKMKEVWIHLIFLQQLQKRIKKYKIYRPEKLLPSVHDALNNELPSIVPGYFITF